MKSQTISLEKYLAETSSLRSQVKELQEQIEWFKRPIFGSRSEKVTEISDDTPTLFDLPPQPEPQKN